MTDVQAAAALFGSDDADDPFATLGTEATAGNEPHAIQAGGTSPNDSIDKGSSFFGSPEGGGDAVPQPTPPVERYPSTNSYSYSQASHQPYGDHQASYNRPTAPALAQVSQGRHDQGNVHDSYAPTPTPAYAPPSQTSYSASPYSYQATPAAQSSYASYAPSTASHAPYTHATSSVPAQNAPPAVPTSNPPPPPVSRPKVANAYDPPFPVNNVRRTVSRGPPAVYNPYTAAATSPPPVPPLPPAQNSYIHSRPTSAANVSNPYGQPPPNTSAYPPPPRPPSSGSSLVQGPYSAPPRPPSTASSVGGNYGQYSQPARPSSSASQQAPPPRPTSTSSNYSPYSPPNRPPSSGANQYGVHTARRTPPPPLPNLPSHSYQPHRISSPPTYGAEAQSTSSLHVLSVIPEPTSPPDVVDVADPEGGTDWYAEEGRQEEQVHGNGYPQPTSPTSTQFSSHQPTPPFSGGYDSVPAASSNDKSVVDLSEDPLPKQAPSPTVSRFRDAHPEDHPDKSSKTSGSPYNYRPSSPASTGRASSPLHVAAQNSNRYRSASASSAWKDVADSSPMPPPPLPVDPYAPRRQLSNGHTVDNVYSIGYPSKPTLNGHSNPYLPNKPPPPPRLDETRSRSMSNTSTFSARSSSEDRYAPLHPGRTNGSEPDYGSYSSRYDFPNNEATLGAPQELTVPTRAPYAPSPSLMGTNDPLGRAGVRVPVFSFGFGGKLVTCFHGATTMSTGFDVALSSRVSTGVDIRVLNKIVPESALDTTVAFPGPLFGDSSSGAIGLVRPGASTQNRKTKVVGYLNERIAEITQGLGYLHSGSLEKRRADGKLVLVKLLKIMVENDGKISGTPEIDMAVRSALVPRLEDLSNEPTSAGFVPPSRTNSVINFSSDNTDVITTTVLRASALDKIQNFLLRGQKKQAYHYALDHQLWAHAMVIASGIDKESWQEVVKEFIKTELGSKDDPARILLQNQSTEPISPSVNGREGLRAVYGLLTGQGAASVQELVPQNLLARATHSLMPPVHQVTPLTPHFASTAPGATIPADALSNWAETVCMMLSQSVTSEVSQTLLALGDQLYTNHWVEAAHVCYLLSSPTLPGALSMPPIGGIGHPSTRMVLPGSRNPQSFPVFSKDPDPMIFAEILEFALSLTPPPKGQEPFAGLPHLQAYRFVRASALAELGYISETTRYCEAITSALAKQSPYFNETLIESLKDLSERLQGVSHSDKNGSWIGGKISKPSLDSIGGWLVNKLVTGDPDSPGLPAEETARPDSQGFSNAFSQYSTISSAAPSTSPSPQSSTVNLHAGWNQPNYRPTERSASAMDNRRKQTTTVPRIASASAATTTFSQAYNHGYQPMSTMSEVDTPSFTTTSEVNEDSEGQEVTWWGDISTSRTPTASNFLRPDNSVNMVTTADGFLSPMGNIPFSPHPATNGHSSSFSRHQEQDEDVEDLGFGNSRPSTRTGVDKGPEPYDPGNASQLPSPEPKETKPSAPERPDPKPTGGSTTGSSWLGRWFKKDSTTPGPVKASLGEESAFYYDKDLKKWVNKKGGAEAAKPAPPPPPPSRPQTASPGMTGPRQVNGNSSLVPPPARSASAIDLTSPPRRGISRMKSNLGPTPELDSTSPYASAPGTPPPISGLPPTSGGLPPQHSSGLVPPPSPLPGRPKSSASKRPVRSRYVDVFAQEGA